ncbi:MAG TPA: hypothetical protein VGH73_19485 [Thermoanaerobaculia bacterium]|jgi:hypothetical protein
MPKNSIASVITAWENVVANAKAHSAEVPSLDVYTVPMEQILAAAKDLNARLDMRRGVKQDESKERKALMLQGKRQVAKVRAVLKAYFGVDSERLLEFGAKPIRARKKKNPLTVPPPATPPFRRRSKPVRPAPRWRSPLGAERRRRGPPKSHRTVKLSRP